MKRLCSVLIASAVVASAVPAMAFENKFGGYWRTRAFSQQDFGSMKETDKDGKPTGKLINSDSSRVDSRTRLYYTAEFSKNFKLVNKFEMDAIWGSGQYYELAPAATDKKGSGAIGADSISVEVKNTYADFTPVDGLNFKIGTQGAALCRGFLFSDDFTGLVMTYDSNAYNFKMPYYWIKYNEGGPGKNANEKDIDVYVLSPEFGLQKGVTLNPVLAYQTQQWTETKIASLGINADIKADNLKGWFTGIYQNGSFTPTYAPDATKPTELSLNNYETDLSAYLIALGAEMDVNKQLNVHGQAFYASGNEAADKNAKKDAAGKSQDNDYEGFYGFNSTSGQDYHWAEIMGGGIFDNQFSVNAPGYGKVTNTSAFNIGAAFKPMDKLTLSGDIWYAMLNEDAKTGKKDKNGKDIMADELGTEVDLKARYMIFENLAIDVVGAYLFAGDATGKDDPMEIGTQLELKF